MYIFKKKRMILFEEKEPKQKVNKNNKSDLERKKQDERNQKT